MALEISLFEALYGRKCRTIINLDIPANRVIIGLDMLKEMEQQVIKIRQDLKVAQGIHKSYVDFKRMPKELNFGDNVYLWVKPKRTPLKLGSYSKLETIFCGPFEYLDRVVAFEIASPDNMKAHNEFHVSFLKLYVHDRNHIINWNLI